MSDTNPMRSREARDALRGRIRDLIASGRAYGIGAVSVGEGLALLDLADEGDVLRAERDEALAAAEKWRLRWESAVEACGGLDF